MAIRNRDLKPDAKGRFRPYLGWKLGDDGVRRQHRFNLGTDRREAERRFTKLREVYEENCRIAGEDTWSPLGLSYAEEVAKGRFKFTFSLPPSVECLEDPLTEFSQLLQKHREWFPSLEILPSDERLYEASLRRNEQLVQDVIKEVEGDLRELGAIPSKNSLPERLIPGTFHEALDEYSKTVSQENVFPGSTDLKPYGRLRLERIKRFKAAHEDIPLHALTYDACTSMIAHWRNRPLGKRGATSRDNARHHIGELMRFFRWLDSTDTFLWQMPRGLRHVSRKITKTDAERKLSVITKEIYSFEELATLNAHATPIERLLLYLGLNCAMGAAEMGRLVASDILLNHRHEFAERLHFDSTDSDSFIRLLRPKTHVFGEWWLWPETAEIVRWGLERSKRIGSDLLLVSEKGMPWYRERASNAQYHFANTWDRLVKRVRKSDPHFKELPFGTLRDTLPDWLRHRENDELASISLAHGSPFHGDSLLECYGNRPYGRLHAALRRAYSAFAPIFAAAPDDPLEEKKQYLPVVVRQRIKSLIAEGRSAPQIARECPVSPMTVYREMGRYDY